MRFIGAVLLAMLWTCHLNAGQFSKVEMPDEITVNGKKLFLNGMGLREVTHMFMDFDVYVAGLYVEGKTSKPDEVIGSRGTRQIKMQFLMNLDSKKLVTAWDESHEKICGSKAEEKVAALCLKIKDSFGEFKKAIQDVKKGQVMDYVFEGKSCAILLDGQKVFSTGDTGLGEFFLTAWLGDKPISSILKDRLLGLKH